MAKPGSPDLFGKRSRGRLEGITNQKPSSRAEQQLHRRLSLRVASRWHGACASRYDPLPSIGSGSRMRGQIAPRARRSRLTGEDKGLLGACGPTEAAGAGCSRRTGNSWLRKASLSSCSDNFEAMRGVLRPVTAPGADYKGRNTYARKLPGERVLRQLELVASATRIRALEGTHRLHATGNTSTSAIKCQSRPHRNRPRARRLMLVTGRTTPARRTHEPRPEMNVPPNVIEVGGWQHPELTRVSAMNRRPPTCSILGTICSSRTNRHGVQPAM